ncbi:MAG: lipid-A-disaccharide synthase [Candidatus Omnitrophica bacterium]|nr:lipid-A-disaccharide synthase [Candidatus Omnitrophota bacterium]
MASIVLVAGDPSGDAHAAHLVTALKARDASLTFTALGGPALQRAGVTLLDDLTTTATIGPFDAAKHLARFRRAAQRLEAHLQSARPTLAILVDFGDFNLPVIAPLVKRYGIPIAYYISPQLWAWGRFRLRFVRRYVERMIVFFKFEEAFYQREGIPVTWVGHPLVERATSTMSKEEALRRAGLNPWRRTVGLLPGSRAHEVHRHLPLMLATARRIARRMPGVQFLLPRAASLPREIFDAALAHAAVDVHVADGSIDEALSCMDAAVVASGTATLETALGGVPMVVVYRASWPTYLAARAVIRIPNIALVNVVAGTRIVPEFVQHHATPKRLAQELVALLRNEERRAAMRRAFERLRETLGPPGAVARAASTVLELLIAPSNTPCDRR